MINAIITNQPHLKIKSYMNSKELYACLFSGFATQSYKKIIKQL